MLLIVVGVIPVLLAWLVWMCGNALGLRHGGPQAPRAREDWRSSASEGHWEALTEEIARRGSRCRPRLSYAAMQHRHLAPVLRADARR